MTAATLADPTQGTLTQDPVTLEWTFTPSATFVSGSAVINYTIEDQDGATDTAIHTVTIGNEPPAPQPPATPPPGEPPVIVDPLDPNNLIVEATDNVPLTLGIDNHFVDPNGDPLSYTVDMSAAPAWLTYDAATETFSGTPPVDNAGVDYVIPVTVDDGNGGTVNSTLTFQITNPTPDAVDDTTVTSVGTAVVVPLLGNDTDPDGDPLTVTSATLADPTQGTLSQDPVSLEWTFTPSATFISGSAVINYAIEDQDGATDIAIHTVTIGNAPPVLEPPVTPPPGEPPYVVDPADPGNLIVEATDNVPLMLGIADKFTDANGDPLAFTVDMTAAPAWLTYDAATNTFSGTPPVDNAGVDVVIPVTVDDGNGGTLNASVTFQITNPVPDAIDDAVVTTIGTPVVVDLLANDTDADGDPLTVTSATLADPTQGTLTQDPVTLAWTFTPSATFVSGSAVINYTIEDQDGATDTAIHTVTMGNEPPVLEPPVTPPPGEPPYVVDPADPGNLIVDGTDNVPLTLGVADKFTDANGDPLSYTVDMTAAPAWLTYDAATETFSGTPPVDNAGVDYVIPVTVDDGNGGTLDASVTFQITNPVPDAIDDAIVTTIGTPVVVDLLANDTDPDGDPLTVTSATLADPTQGTLTQDPVTLAWTFTPSATFVSGSAVINYTIEDQDGATDTDIHTVTIANEPPAPQPPVTPPPGEPPVVVDPADPNNLIVEGTDNVPLTLGIADKFIDPNGDPLSYTVDMSGAPAWLTYDAATETFSGTPPVDNAGVDYVIPVTVDDGNGGTINSTLTFQITNPAPDAVDETTPGVAGQPVIVDLLANDIDVDGDPIAVTTATLADPSAGTLVQDPATFAWTFTPAPGFSGPAVINYTIEDQDGATDSAIHTIDVPNVPPVLIDPEPVPGTPEIDPADPGNLIVRGNDNEPLILDLGPYFRDDNLDDLTISVDPSTIPTWLTWDPVTNTLSGTPPVDNEGIDYVIAISVDDGKGGVFNGTVTFDITNPAPDAVDETTAGIAGQPVIVDLLANDVDPDGDPMTVISATLANPADGTLVQDPATLEWTFTPAPGFSGPALINYTIEDQDGATDTATHTVDVPNEPPSLVDPDPTPGTPEIDPADPGNLIIRGFDNEPLEIDLGPYFEDPNLDELTVTPDPATIPSWLTWDPVTKTLSGTPPVDNEEIDYVIDVVVDDGKGGVFTGSLTFEITNPPPVAVDDGPFKVTEGLELTLAVLDNDGDPDGDPIRVVEASSPNGNVVVLPDGTIVFTPDLGFVGTTEIVYTITDDDGGFDTAIVTVEVEPAIFVAPPEDQPPVKPDAPVVTYDHDVEGGILATSRAITDQWRDEAERRGALAEHANPYLRALSGFSLKFGDDAWYSPKDDGSAVRLESIVTRGVLSLSLFDISEPDAPRVQQYEIRMLDGSDVPAWLEWPGSAMLQGHVPAHIDYLDLEIAVKLQDGREIIQPIRLWTKTGVIEPLPAQKASIGAGENRRADAEATSPIETQLARLGSALALAE